MLLKIIGFLLGYVSVSITGGSPERFINLCAFHRLDMWNIHHHSDKVTANIRLADYKKIRPFAKMAGIHVHIYEKHGLPFWTYRYRHRYGLLVGMLVFSLVLSSLCGRIWTIEVHGMEEAEVVKILSEFGVRTGVSKNHYDWSTVRQTIMQKHSEFAWMSLNPEGTKLQVDVSKRVEPPNIVPSHEPCNIKASQDGTILEIQAYNGTAVVKVGEGVVKGDLLISGAVEYKDGCTFFRHAQGKVIAQTTHKITIQVPFEQTVTEKTGESTTRRVLRLFNFMIPLYVGSVNQPYIKETNTKPLVVDGVELPFALELARFHFTASRTISLSEEEAMAEAMEKIDALAEKDLSHVTVIKMDYDTKKTQTHLQVTATIIGKENIGFEEKMLIF